MAAHALTIIRQVKKLLDEGKPVTGDFTFAPGLDVPYGFSVRNYMHLYNGFQDYVETKDEVPFRLALHTVESSVLWMDAYPEADAIRQAMQMYVRTGTPYYKAREQAFLDGDEKTHKVARRMLAEKDPVYPMSRTAPRL